MVLSCALWTFFVTLVPIIGGGIVLQIVQIVCGICTGATFVLANQFSKSWMGLSEQGRVWGLFFFCINAAILLGSFGAAWAASIGSWGLTTFVLFLLGVLTIFLLIFFYEDKPSTSKRVSNTEKGYINREKKIVLLGHVSQVFMPLSCYLRSSVFLTTSCAFFFWGLMLYFGASWFPTHESLNGGVSLIVINRVGLLVGTLMGGWYSDYRYVKSKDLQHSRANIIFLCYILGTFCCIVSIIFWSPIAAILLNIIGFFFFGCAHPLFFALVQSVTYTNLGVKVGIVNASYALGALVCPLIISLLGNYFGNANIGIMILVISGGLTAVILAIFQRPNYDLAKHLK